eukprot:scaffold2220_cov75-Cylindrotheca_fusiformis.AAC.7
MEFELQDQYSGTKISLENAHHHHMKKPKYPITIICQIRSWVTTFAKEKTPIRNKMVSPIIHRHSVEMDSCEEEESIYTVKTNKLIIEETCTTIVVSLATRSVSFTSEIFVKETIGLEEYTQVEIDSSWYSENEIRQISECCLDILSDQDSRLLLLHEEEDDDETKKYIRGLEPYTVLGSIARRKNRHTAISLVLTEQLKQRREQERDVVMDVDLICDIYSNATSSSQLWAHVTAIQDRREAEAYLDEEEDDSDFLESRKRKQQQQQQPNKTSNFHSDVQSTGRLVAMHKVLPRAA